MYGACGHSTCACMEFKLDKLHESKQFCDIFNQRLSLKKSLTESDKLLKIYLTVPATTCTASVKHNFSALKQKKAILKECYDTAASKPLKMLLHIHQDQTNTLNLQGITEELCSEECINEAYGSRFKHSSVSVRRVWIQ